MNTNVSIALIQSACVENVEQNIKNALNKTREAAQNGAKIVCLQELFNTLYIGQDVDVAYYDYAEILPGATSDRFGALSKELGIVTIVPMYEYVQPGIYFNSVVVYDADGTYLGKYRKNHIPDGPQYLEKYYFTPGNTGYPIFKTKFGKIAVGICWDEWFPEVARIFALQGAQIIFYPSAIGSEPDRPELSTASAWEKVISAHGICNSVYIAAVNRVGTEQGKSSDMTFYGASFVSNPLGEIMTKGGDAEEIIYANIDLDFCKEAADLLQFHRDRRVDTYKPILKMVIE
ncbi:carbon-nitrogen hydrolase [Flavobacterium sp. TSSA_36]|uniref:carbon-nitrogen hydrolase n=1 Tax=Flavobacterium sp. TSSA_36 TaxID=3447669 RepID=UPI003F2D8B52